MHLYAFQCENGVKWRRENQRTDKRKSVYCYQKQLSGGKTKLVSPLGVYIRFNIQF